MALRKVLELVLRSTREGKGAEETQSALGDLEKAFNAVKNAAAVGAVVAAGKFTDKAGNNNLAGELADAITINTLPST